MAKQLTNKNTLLVGLALPVAADVITTDEKVFINPQSKNIEYSDIGNGMLGNAKSLVNDDYVTADFSATVKARVATTVDTAPEIGDLLKICGLSETNTLGVNMTYAPTSTILNGQAKLYVDDYYRLVTGVAGTFTFGGAIGEIAKFNFNLKGFTTFNETMEVNPTVALDTNNNLIIKSATVITVGGTEFDIENFEFNINCDIQEVYALNTKEFYISDYKPTIKIKAIKTKGNSTHWTELANNTKKSVVVVLTDGTRTLTLTAPYCQPTTTNESDENAAVVYDREWNCEASAGGDNFSLVYS